MQILSGSYAFDGFSCFDWLFCFTGEKSWWIAKRYCIFLVFLCCLLDLGSEFRVMSVKSLGYLFSLQKFFANKIQQQICFHLWSEPLSRIYWTSCGE